MTIENPDYFYMVDIPVGFGRYIQLPEIFATQEAAEAAAEKWPGAQARLYRTGETMPELAE